MRQSDGADLPGANNPPNADTGIIYVSSDDARQSILEAILRQDKRGRKHIVLVLPVKTGNKALSRSADFDGLKGMRGDLYAQLVIIAPTGSTPAELARQRRFPVYPDLEAFARSLQDAGQTPSSPVQPTGNSDEQERGQAPPTPTDDDDDRVQTFPLASPTGEDSASTQQENAPEPALAEPAVPLPAENDEEQIILVPPPPRAQSVSNYPVPAGAAVPARSGAVVPAGNAPRRRRWWIALLIVLLVLLVGFLAYQPLLNLIFVPNATVTITPASKQLKNTYTITAVVGTPDAAQSQVQARILFVTSETLQKTANASGVADTPATQATGVLTFYNTSPAPKTVPAGTVFLGASGVAVVNDASVTVPASVLPATGQISAPAHAVNAGSSGNIPANDLNAVACCGAPTVLVSNLAPFAGGMDAQPFSYVEQSDIDGTAATLATSLTAKTQADLVKQIQPGEQLAASPRCVPLITSDQAAGDKVDTVTVSASVYCTGEVFDQRGAYGLAENLLTTDPALHPGTAYAPVGHIVTKIQQAAVNAQNVITLTVLAEGVWVYQFTATQLNALRRLVVGKTQQDAQSVLLKQSGVHQTSIQLSGLNGSTLPSDPKQIEVYVLNVPGM
jgi:VCBS repeat-containing protein